MRNGFGGRATWAPILDTGSFLHLGLSAVQYDARDLWSNETRLTVACNPPNILVDKRAEVLDGQLKVGDFIVAGRGYGRVRDITDDRGNKIKEFETSLLDLIDQGHVDLVVDYASFDAFCHLKTVEWVRVQ